MSLAIAVLLAGQAGHELTTITESALRADPRVLLTDTVFGRIATVDADLIVVAGYRHLIPEWVYSQARIGAVGIHPALLPRYRGSYPLWWALRNGEREAGVTLYRLGPGIDDGPILAQTRVPIQHGDTFASLYARVVAEIPNLLGDLLSDLYETRALPAGQPQDEAFATVYRTPTRSMRAVARVRLAVARWGFVIPLVLLPLAVLGALVTLVPGLTGGLSMALPVASIACVGLLMWLTYHLAGGQP